MPHNPLGPICTAANIHFGAAVPNYAWLEVRALEFTFSDDIFPVQPQLEGTGTPYPPSRGWASRSTRRCSASRSASGKPPTSTGATAPTPTGRQLPGAPSR